LKWPRCKVCVYEQEQFIETFGVNPVFIKSSLEESDYSVPVPYGIIEYGANNEIRSIVEKPTYTYFCNSGIYALNTNIVKGIENDYLDMPDLINQVKLESKVYIYKMYEYWNDIGQIDDYNRECNR